MLSASFLSNWSYLLILPILGMNPGLKKWRKAIQDAGMQVRCVVGLSLQDLLELRYLRTNFSAVRARGCSRFSFLYFMDIRGVYIVGWSSLL